LVAELQAVLAQVVDVFARLPKVDWARLWTREGLLEAWAAIRDTVTEAAESLWTAIKPIEWAEYISEVSWVELAGGVFALALLVRPIVWTAALLGAPIRWIALLGRFALKTLIKPIIWTPMLIGGAIRWTTFLGTFALKSLVLPIVWTAKLLGGPIRWIAFLGRFALSKLLVPIVWTAKLLGAPVPWLKLLGRFAVSALLSPVVWSAVLLGGPISWVKLLGRFALSRLLIGISWATIIPKIPWLATAGGGKRFALSRLLVPLKWGARLIPGIGWAMLAGELIWNLLIKPIDWSQFGWLKFDWAEILPSWNWGRIIPALRQADFDVEAETRASVVVSGSVDTSALTDRQRALLERMAQFRADAHQGPAPVITIEDPDTLLQAAEAAERLEAQFPKISAAATAALAATRSVVSEIVPLFSDLDLGAEGARLMRMLADGIRAQRSEVAAAAAEITAAIRGALPRTATLKIGVQGSAPTHPPVQARAKGGTFGPGWLLTGESGAELEYRTRGGFIAHNAALQRLVSMSELAQQSLVGPAGVSARIGAAAATLPDVATAVPTAALARLQARLPALARQAPSLFGRAAMVSGIAAHTAASAEATADPPDGARYLTSGGSGPVSVSAPISLTITGSVDKETMPDLRAALAELEDRLMERLDAANRRTRRLGHD